MKEKIGIEKLIKLLNEYGNEICNHWGNYQTDMDFTNRDTYWYLSKKFGFIKWLVENDKIDFSREGDLSNELVNLFGRKLDNAEGVIALLSIKDEPIRFLCEIIK